MKSTFKLLATVLVAASFVTACGGDNEAYPVASTNTTVAISPTTGAALVAAVANQPFSFETGVPDFDTTTPTTVTLSGGAAPGFDIAAEGASTQGNLTFGSCIFTLTKTTFPGSKKLGTITTTPITINPCSLTLATAGTPADGQDRDTSVKFILRGASSTERKFKVRISADGTVSVGGVVIGTVVITNATGT